MAFVIQDETGGTGIYALDLGGGRPELLSTRSGAVQPAWSPDRSQIAFVGIGREESDFANLYVMNADGSNIRRLTEGPAVDMSPDWSPDGTRIAFSRHYGSTPDLGHEAMDIYVIDVEEGDEQNVTDDAATDGHPDWSPDGKTIAFFSDRAGTADIWIVNPEGGAPEQLTEGTEVDWEPNWSPDGTEILFSRELRFTESSIYVMNHDGSDVGRLTPPGGYDASPTWSPDGALIAFARDGEDRDIYIMARDGSHVKALTRTDDAAFQPAWAS